MQSLHGFAYGGTLITTVSQNRARFGESLKLKFVYLNWPIPNREELMQTEISSGIERLLETETALKWADGLGTFSWSLNERNNSITKKTIPVNHLLFKFQFRIILSFRLAGS